MTQPDIMRSNDTFEYALLTLWVELAHVGLCVLDEAGTVTVLNRAACNFLQADAAAVMNRPVRVLFRTAVNAVAAEIWIQNPALQEDFVLECKAGDHRWYIKLAKSCVQDAKGASYQVISLSDVTALVLARHQLKHQAQHDVQQRRWQALNAGVVICDALLPDMPITYANPAFVQMTGYALSEMRGQNCRFLQGSGVRQAGVQVLRDAIQSQSSGYAVLNNYRKDGSRFVSELFISPIRDASGNVTQFLGIAHLRADRAL